MEIRRAVLTDVPSIQDIATSFAVMAPDDPRTFGFYKYPFSDSQYIQRLNSPFFIIAETRVGLEGFCMGYDEMFYTKISEERSSVVQSYLMNNAPKPFIYLDQLAVRKPGTIRSARAASALMSRLIAQSDEQQAHIACAVVHTPWMNHTCRKFIRHLSFNQIGEVSAEDVGLGIYLRAAR